MARSRNATSRPTLRTVAERAGVSKSLVSLVINGSPHVSKARRTAVLKAARELGYRPHRAARTLVEGRTRLIGVVISDVQNPWWVELVRGLEDSVRDTGYRVLLGDSEIDPRADDALVDAYQDLQVDGIIIAGSSPARVALNDAAKVVPMVLAGFRDARITGADTVTCDDAAGVEMVVDHLVSLGHRRVAHIAGATDNAMAVTRREAYETAMRKRGLSAEVRVEGSASTEFAGYEAASRLLASEVYPSAVVAVNDLTAIGMLSAAEELGLDVPGQVSVAGYENTPYASFRHSSLTSVDISPKELGRSAARLLLERIRQPDRPVRTVLVEPTLVQRSSTARAPD